MSVIPVQKAPTLGSVDILLLYRYLSQLFEVGDESRGLDGCAMGDDLGLVGGAPAGVRGTA